MSRKARKTEENTAAPATGVTPPLDAGRDGSVPMRASGGIGGSVRGRPLVEGNFIVPNRSQYVETPFGQRYAIRKPRGFTTRDVLARAQVWAFDIAATHIYTTGASPLTWMPGIIDAAQVLAQWYELTRDLAMRSIKYKPTPTSLTNPLVIRDYWNAYYYVLANATTLLNLNRLLMYSPALGLMGRYLPQVIARLNRLWIRLESVAAPAFLKAHAIRNGSIVFQPGIIQPTLRLWSPGNLMASASGGPGVYDTSNTINGLFTSSAAMASYVSGLEETGLWLERGSPSMSAALLMDFTAMKDIMSMVNDVVPGTYQQGLPPSASLPGFSNNPGLIVDLTRRAVFRKDIVTGFTDKWLAFPVPEQDILLQKIPVITTPMKEAKLGLYDCTLLGAAKYGMLKPSAFAFVDDVDKPFLAAGTDLMVGDEVNRTNYDVRTCFGVTPGSVDEEVYTGLAGTYAGLYSAFDVNNATAIRAFNLRDSLRSMNPWDDIRYADRSSWPDEWPRFVQEDIGFEIVWVDTEDLGWNYGEFLAKMLAIPYSRFSS